MAERSRGLAKAGKAALALGALGVVLPVAWSETLADAIALAYANNPQLLAERARVRATDEGIAQARAGRLPSASLQADAGVRWTGSETLFGRNENDGAPRSVALSANQPVFTGGRVPALERQAEAQVDAAAAQLTATEQSVLLATVQAFVDVRRDLEIVNARVVNVDRLRRQLEGARIRFEVGEITRTDVAQAESRLAQAEAGLATARATLDGSRAAYVRVVGQAPGELAPVPPAPGLPPNLTRAVEIGLDRNPEIDRAAAAVRSADASARVAVSDLLPRVDVTARASRDEPGFGTTTTTDSAQAFATLRVPLYEQGLARSRVRQARIETDRARLLEEDARRAVTQAVARLWGEVEAARRVIEASRQQVAAAEIALEGANEELAVGLRTTLDVLDAEQELLEANLALIAAERNAYVASHQLLAAMGALDLETLGVNISLYDPLQHRDAVRDDLWGFGTRPKPSGGER